MNPWPWTSGAPSVWRAMADVTIDLGPASPVGVVGATGAPPPPADRLALTAEGVAHDTTQVTLYTGAPLSRIPYFIALCTSGFSAICTVVQGTVALEAELGLLLIKSKNPVPPYVT